MKKAIIRKRENFLKIFTKASVFSVLATGIFCAGLRGFVLMHLNDSFDSSALLAQSNIEKALKDSENSYYDAAVNSALCQYTAFDTGYSEGYRFPIISSDDEGSTSVSVIRDENNNILFTNENKFICFFSFGPDNSNENGWYICDWKKSGNPKMQELFDNNYGEIVYDGDTYNVINIEKAVLNKSNHTFFPLEITDTVHIRDINDLPDATVKETHYSLNADGFEGEEVNFTSPVKRISSEDTARCGYAFFAGASEEEINKYINNEIIYEKNNHFSAAKHFIHNGKNYELTIMYSINPWNKRSVQYILTGTAIFFVISVLIALLYSWRRNILNKAQYKFEDYQKALTNNLAHDIKTPLMAIGGYTENLIEKVHDEKEIKYLESILENVRLTDTIINRTLQLNKAETVSKLNITEFSIISLCREILSGYDTKIKEKGIETKITGDKKIKADRELFAAAIENIISNAVKYTKNSGTIEISISKNQIRITNDVDKKTDTKDLLLPFVKGDQTRNDKSGSGLGLSIADTMLKVNGSKLKISCSDKKFETLIEL